MSQRPPIPLTSNAGFLLLLALIGVIVLKGCFFKEPQPEPEQTAPAAAVVAPVAELSPGAELHPAAQEFADRLSRPAPTAEEDIQELEELLALFRRSLGENPEGDNPDVVSALLGANRLKVAFLPASVSVIRQGQLVDRWGTPYFLHPESAQRMTIRSAGPDARLFTEDDLVSE